MFDIKQFLRPPPIICVWCDVSMCSYSLCRATVIDAGVAEYREVYGGWSVSEPSRYALFCAKRPSVVVLQTTSLAKPAMSSKLHYV